MIIALCGTRRDTKLRKRTPTVADHRLISPRVTSVNQGRKEAPTLARAVITLGRCCGGQILHDKPHATTHIPGDTDLRPIVVPPEREHRGPVFGLCTEISSIAESRKTQPAAKAECLGHDSAC